MDVETRITGPFPITPADIAPLNELFAAAFSERYRRDGMSGVRVPPLHPDIWKFAVEGAAAGAMLWRDGLGRIAAFNLAHVSGREGWMGPLAVREELQGHGLGQTIVKAGIAHLRAAGCTTIGLETMPRTMENIGFYARLGFVPGPLTITLSLDAHGVDAPMPELLSTHGLAERKRLIAECAALTDSVRAGADYSREMSISLKHGIGDVVLMRDAATDAITGFALYHDVPLVEGRGREELRVLKCVLADEERMVELARLVRMQARRSQTLRVAIRMHGEYGAAFAALIADGARVRWTDLRMVLGSAPEGAVSRGIALSNWEI
jgi:GNAT superfamily N-acetyltransferase